MRRPGQPARDGYQYGVRWSDGSVTHRWNGDTQRARAATYLAEVLELFPRDALDLVRRRVPDGQWEPVPEPGEVNEDSPPGSQ